ncbi:hypothetical protein [Lentilactobacillus sp. Marseille-Q4993]|uniref:hypothetical protein n=1 Tax=Lentilactobacillus sp. Marseille-Q4993 TaxID=3039492 RepID=UPI0024BD460E|nr:hypothetical protein [Lentilactobacillus sp. Marseille-Q4993]
MKKVIAVFAVFLVPMVMAKFLVLQDGPSHTKIQREMKSALLEERPELGKKPSVKVDKDKGATIKLDESSKAVRDAKKGGSDQWSDLVSGVVKKSKEFKGVYENPQYANIKVKTKDSKKPLLKVDKGKVLYNVAEK